MVSQGLVITDWESNLEGLKPFDAILVTSTRNSSPYCEWHDEWTSLMAISSARARKTPCMIVPSMHLDLANDPSTNDCVTNCCTMSFGGEANRGREKKKPKRSIYWLNCLTY